MRTAEALHPIERGDEAQRGDRPDVGNGLEPPHHRVVCGVPGQPHGGGRDLQVERLHHRQQRSDLGAQRSGSAQHRDSLREAPSRQASISAWASLRFVFK